MGSIRCVWLEVPPGDMLSSRLPPDAGAALAAWKGRCPPSLPADPGLSAGPQSTCGLAHETKPASAGLRLGVWRAL